jgi:hypothetical protein
MAVLNDPTRELAERVLREVGYDQRLVGLKMAAMGGAHPSDLFSLREAARFIHVDDYETALRDNHATVGYIDLKALARWIDEVIGDGELSAAIAELAGGDVFYGNIALSVKDLLVDRVTRCQSVLASDVEGANS